MNVGVLGSGDVGRALARGFASRGHEVKIASRDPNGKELVAWLKQVRGKASSATYREAAKHGDVLVLAVLGSAWKEVVGLAGPENFAGKS